MSLEEKYKRVRAIETLIEDFKDYELLAVINRAKFKLEV